MRATLEFTVPEEKDEFLQAIAAGALASSLHDIYQVVRSVRKYDLDPSEAVERIAALLADVQQHLWD